MHQVYGNPFSGTFYIHTGGNPVNRTNYLLDPKETERNGSRGREGRTGREALRKIRSRTYEA